MYYHISVGTNPVGYPVEFKDYGKEYQYDIYPDNAYVKFEGIYEPCYKELLNVTYVNWIEWIAYESVDEKHSNNDYMVVIQKDETNIIGYAIVEFINIHNTALFYTATIVESMSFPKIDGKYQEINKEYIFNRLDEIKNGTNIYKD